MTMKNLEKIQQFRLAAKIKIYENKKKSRNSSCNNKKRKKGRKEKRNNYKQALKKHIGNPTWS